MQTVWSRVAQARCMCNCPTCVSSTNALSRRATTATTRGRIRFGNAFTVLSSSIAATAAFADSRRKEVRRREWERVIGETRAEIEAKETDQQNRLAVLAQIAEREGFGIPEDDVVCEDQSQRIEGQPIRKVHDPYGPRLRTSAPDLKTDSWGDVFEWAAHQDQARATAGFQDWRGPPLSLLQKLSNDQLEELLQDDRLLRRFYGGQDCSTVVDETTKSIWSSKKLRTLEWSVAKLVYHFLLQCSENPLANGDEGIAPLLVAENGITTKPMSKAEESLGKAEAKSSKENVSVSSNSANIYSKLSYIDSRLESLHLDYRDDLFYEEFESPKLPRYRGNSSHDYGNVTALNEALYSLLHGMEREKDLSPLMTKICYNLLTSKNPPNIKTYNLLLVRFCQLGNEELVRAVLTSMRESHIRPNEVTHSTTLRFFTTMNNSTEFEEYVNRMNGYCGGLALVKAGQQISPIAMHTVRSFGQAGAKLAIKARMNGEIYVSLIVGTLKYLSSQKAMFYYRRMISEGWKPDTEVLTAILRHCCYRSDWNAGLLVWEQILDIAHRASTLSYEWMLRLCQVCEQQDIFDQLLKDGVDRGALPVSMLQLPNEVKTQNITSILEYAETIQRHDVRRIVPLRTRKWIRKLSSDNSNYALDNAFQACADEAAVRAMAERLKKKAKGARNSAPETSQLLERRLDKIVKSIDYTAKGVRRLAHTGDAANLKYRLSVKIKLLNKAESESLGHDAYAASNYTKGVKASTAKQDKENGIIRNLDVKIARTPKGPPIDHAKLSTAPNGEAGVSTQQQDVAPKRQHLPMIPFTFPTGINIQDPTPWEDLERPLAADAG